MRTMFSVETMRSACAFASAMVASASARAWGDQGGSLDVGTACVRSASSSASERIWAARSLAWSRVEEARELASAMRVSAAESARPRTASASATTASSGDEVLGQGFARLIQQVEDFGLVGS